jgi:hypothetical protein
VVAGAVADPCRLGELRDGLAHADGRGCGRLAQRESTAFTRQGSLVRSQYRPPGQAPESLGYSDPARPVKIMNVALGQRQGSSSSPHRVETVADRVEVVVEQVRVTVQRHHR